MKAIILIIAVLAGVNLNAADVTVTAFDAYPPGNTGSIDVSINSLLGSAPFIITVTKGSSVIHTESVSGYNWSLGNLPPGFYCVHIEAEDGCVATVCITIDKCTSWFGNVHCFPVIDPELDDRVLVAGEPLDGGDGNFESPGNEEDYFYVWHSSIVDSSANEETFSFESKHPPGLYYVLIESVDGSIYSQKIMLIRDH